MPNPQCPTCGSPMQLRTARRGRNAGQQFYGCTRYPTCRGILNHQEVESSTPVDTAPNTPTPQLSLPHKFVARPRFEGYQVRFFQSVAATTSVIEGLTDGELTAQAKRAFSQWRLDYPSPVQQPAWNERERQALSVAEKILTRGRITLCSPVIEDTYRKRFLGTEKLHELSLTDQLLSSPPHDIGTDFWLDGPAEKVFYSDYLPNKYGTNFLRWVCPQVEITNLISANAAPQVSGRVDFLICHPHVDKPIIVEIDGQAHQSQGQQDALRDDALSREGFRVIRINSSELESQSGVGLTTLEGLFVVHDKQPDEVFLHNQKLIRYIHAIKLSHQIQLTLLQAIQTGFLPISDSSAWRLSSDLDKVGWLNESESLFVLKSSVDELLSLLRNVGQLYSIQICIAEPSASLGSGSAGIHLAFTGSIHSFLPTFLIQNVSVPFDIANSVFETIPAILDTPSPNTVQYFLNYLFRKQTLWEGQYDAISRTLQGKDSIVLLPTGAGKSMAFQLASFLLPGRAVVIDPIIALMDDQIDNLQSVGIDRAIAITGHFNDPQERSRVLSLFGQGEYLFAYIAPERLQIVEFRESLLALTSHTPISLIAVDEAHCISEWGHDFRTAYLNIGRTSRHYCQSGGITPPLLALTGTASRAVLKDVQRELQIEDFDATITPKSFDRPELKFHVVTSSSAEKVSRLLGYLGQTLPSRFTMPPASFFQTHGKATYSGLVFCPHVNGEYGVVEVSEKIRASLSIPLGIYSGKEPKFYSEHDWKSAKQRVTRQFKHNQIPLLVSTKAFGMGIDKPNIRYTVHYGIPPSIESFYQEAGRAGRDRKTAYCCIIVSVDDAERAKHLLDPNTKPEEVLSTVKNLSWDDNDDVTRALFFQTNAFPGIAVEKSRVAQVIRSLPDLSTRAARSIKFSDLARPEAEKALHRLVVLGIISDYTINYNTDEFTVKLAGATTDSIIETYGRYVAGYLGARRQAEIDKASKLTNLPLTGFAFEMVDLLLHFIYDVIERGRRRALSEMLLASTAKPSDSAIRQRILRYLEATEYSEALEAILSQSDAGLTKTKEIVEAIRSPNEAAELRGQVARYLESYPDHPGLLMLRSLAEAFSRDKNATIVQQNFSASISSASENYSVDEAE